MGASRQPSPAKSPKKASPKKSPRKSPAKKGKGGKRKTQVAKRRKTRKQRKQDQYSLLKKSLCLDTIKGKEKTKD